MKMLRWLLLVSLCLLSGGPVHAYVRGQAPMALGLNLQGPAYFSYEQLFLNRNLMSSGWFCPNCTPLSYAQDAQGYPMSNGGAIASSAKPVCNQMMYNWTGFTGQKYVIRYVGDGVHDIADAGTIGKLGYAGGTFIDTTPGRLVLQMPNEPGSGDILAYCMTADDPDLTGNYIRGVALIDCGSNAALGQCANENAYIACTQPNGTCIDPAWATVFGTRSVGGPGFTSYRFMDWMGTNGDSDGNWADRSLVNYYSYAIGGSPQNTGVPLEAVFSVINQTCADGWINVPGIGISITSDGTFTGVITGSGSSGTLTVSGLTGSITVGDYLTWSGGTQYGLYVSASLGGGQYTVKPAAGSSVSAQSSISMTASYVDTLYIQEMATVAQANIVWCNPNQKLRVEVGNEPWNFTPYGYNYFGGLGNSLWGVGGTEGGFNFRGMITAIAGNIFKTTFGSQSGHIQAVLNIQAVTDTGYGMGNEGCTFASHNCPLLDTPLWANGPAYDNGVDLGVIADYYTLQSIYEPSDWLTLPDGGLSKLYSELVQGNQALDGVDTMTQSGGTGYNANVSCNYVPLSGGSGAGALGQFVTNGSGVPTLQLSSSQLTGSFNVGEKYAVNDTLSIGTNSCLGSGSGWSGTVTSVFTTDPNATESAITYSTTLISTWKTFLATYSLGLGGYEGGDQLLTQGGSDPMLTLVCAWDSYSPAQTFTLNFINSWRTAAGQSTVFNYYTDTSACAYPSSWGLKYYPQQGTAPKYGGAASQLNFLLNRDLPGHPANDDRPVGLDEAA